MMINCPECGHEVSDQAEHCPHCGVAIAKKPRSRKGCWLALAIMLLLLAAAAAGVYFYYQYTKKQNEQYAYQNAMESSETAILQNFLDIYVDAPASHRDSIKNHLERLHQIDMEWTNVVRSKSKSALVRYAQRYPHSVHVTEARLLVDSLDWVQAATTNTMESYQTYMNAHQDGMHYDEAKMNYETLDQRQVTPEEQQMISQLFTTYFNSLAQDDETGLLGTLATVVHTFFNRHNVSSAEVINYMKKLHEAADIVGMSFLLNNDWKIDKIENNDTGETEYAVTFSLNQHIDRTDPNQEKQAAYKVSARVSMDGRIVDMNMRKVITK